MGQAVASACNIILCQKRLGLEAHDCAVPIILTNGNLYQFVWVSLLEESFPVAHVTTDVINAKSGFLEVARNLTCIKLFCEKQARKISESFTLNSNCLLDSSNAIFISKQLYHKKIRKNIFVRFDYFEKSLDYMWDIYEALKDVEEVVKPLCFARLDSDEEGLKNSDELIFPMLVGFTMGVPTDNDTFAAYIKELLNVIKKVHHAGVVHLDLYPSNIMWKLEGGHVVIRIVDWDAASKIGEAFPENMTARTQRKDVSQYYFKTSGIAEPKCDYWCVHVLSKLTEKQKEQMQGEPESVNVVFRNCVDSLNETIDADFESWYNDLKCNNPDVM